MTRERDAPAIGTTEDTPNYQEFFSGHAMERSARSPYGGQRRAPHMIRAIEECLPRLLRPKMFGRSFNAHTAARYHEASPALARLRHNDSVRTCGKRSGLGAGLSRRPVIAGLHGLGLR
jgi:hypothetical protein